MAFNALAPTTTIQGIRTCIRSLLEQADVAYKVIPFDEDLYQKCIDVGMRRGYIMDDQFLRTYLRTGVIYSRTTCSHDPAQIVWVAFFTACGIFVDDIFNRFPSLAPDMRLFHHRLVNREPQGHANLDTFADILRSSSDVFQPISCHMIIASTLSFVGACIIEYETKSKISEAAREYPTYRRTSSGLSEAFAYMSFPQDIPLDDYVQAIPTVILYINDVNDVLSFYKEEQEGDQTNRVCITTKDSKKSKLEALVEIMENVVELCKRIEEILEDSREACDAFKHYKATYIHFHITAARYRLKELNLEATFEHHMNTI